MRELARDWMTSLLSFTRGHGGGEKANASVGAAFVVGALVVAVLGLRWVSASGSDEKSADDTPWEFEETGAEGPTTTVPASTPAKVVILEDPGTPEGATVTTLPPGTGIFLPGFPPTPGGTTGTTDGPDGPPPTDATGNTTRTTTRIDTTSSSRPSIPPPTSPTIPPTTPTVPETTTTSEEPTTTTTLEDPPLDGLTSQLNLDVNGSLDRLGWPFA